MILKPADQLRRHKTFDVDSWEYIKHFIMDLWELRGHELFDIDFWPLPLHWFSREKNKIPVHKIPQNTKPFLLTLKKKKKPNGKILEDSKTGKISGGETAYKAHHQAWLPNTISRGYHPHSSPKGGTALKKVMNFQFYSKQQVEPHQMN